MPVSAPKSHLSKQRVSIRYLINCSAEVFGMFNIKKEFEPKVVEKSEEAFNRISERLS